MAALVCVLYWALWYFCSTKVSEPYFRVGFAILNVALVWFVLKMNGKQVRKDK